MKTITTIPAQPGWYYCETVEENDIIVDIFTLSPVIAWLIISDIERGNSYAAHEVCTEVFPITSEGTQDTSAILLRPDGKYEQPWSWYAAFDKQEALINLNEDLAARKERDRIRAERKAEGEK